MLAVFRRSFVLTQIACAWCLLDAASGDESEAEEHQHGDGCGHEVVNTTLRFVRAPVASVTETTVP